MTLEAVILAKTAEEFYEVLPRLTKLDSPKEISRQKIPHGLDLIGRKRVYRFCELVEKKRFELSTPTLRKCCTNI